MSPGAPKGLAGGVIAAEAAAAVPDRMLATEMAADQHAQPGARAAPRLFGELQRQPLGRHDIVAPDGAFFFDAEDLLEIDTPERHKRGGRVGRWAAELGVEGRQEPVAHIAIGGCGRADAGDAQLVDEAGLDGAVTRLA